MNSWFSLWTLVRAGLQTQFLKNTFLHGEADMLSFNILTIFALLLFVSCGLASKKEVNIFFISYISFKKHFSKGITFQSNYWTGIYREVNVLIESLNRQVVPWPEILQRLFHHVHEQTKSGKKRLPGKTVKTSHNPVPTTFIIVL